MNKKERLGVLISAFLISMAYGTNYAWSIFGQELRVHFGFTAAASATVFAVFQLAFSVAFITGGIIVRKYGPKKIAIAGGIIQGAGYFLAGCFEPNPWLLCFFVGIIGGGGIGLGYVAPMYAVQNCYPEKRSFVTGISVAGLGVGAMIMALIAEALISSGMYITTVLKAFGIFFLVYVCSFAFLLKAPDDCEKENIKPLPYRDILTSRIFWGLFIPMTAGIFAGLMIIGNLKTMGINWGVTSVVAAAGVSLLSIFNAFGRIAWGYVSGKVGEEKTIVITLSITCLTMLLASLVSMTAALYLVFVIIIGFSYGAVLVVYASSTSKHFGVERLGQIYPLLFLSNVIGLTAATFAGYLFDKTKSFTPALVVGAILCVAGIIAFKILLQNKQVSK